MVAMAGHTRAAWTLLVAVLATGCAAPATSVPPSASPTLEPMTAPTVSVAPTASPTLAPDPTPEGASAPRVEVEVNHDIIDRPGVPAEMRNNYWWSYADAGLLGTTAQIGVPSNERILHVAHGLVVSTRDANDGWGPSTLVVRSFETGQVRSEIVTRIGWPDARIVGDRLFWTGLEASDQAADGATDGGVWTVDLGGGEPTAIVEAGTLIDTSLAGRRLLLSPSGRTIGAVLSSYGTSNWMDVVDVMSASLTRRIEQVWPWAVTDESFLMWDQKPTDGLTFGLGAVAGHDLETSKVRWRFPDQGGVPNFAPYVTATVDSTFILQYAWQTGDRVERIVAAFDARSGKRLELFIKPDQSSEDELELQPDMSASGFVALAPENSGLLNRPIAVIEVATGAVTRDAFVIEPAWICTEEFCYRD